MGLGEYIKKRRSSSIGTSSHSQGMGFAMISGHPDVFCALVLAGGDAYLGFIGTHPRFQRHVDAQEHKAARAEQDAEAVERLMPGVASRASPFSSSQGSLHLGTSDRRAVARARRCGVAALAR